MIGLDVAGIDFICPDIASPVRETGGAICEVNAAPGFRMHTHPTVGEPQYIAKPVVDLLFPPGPSRVPIVAVTGTNGKTTTSRMIAHIFKGIGRKVGMTSTDGIVIDERLVIKSDASGPRSARMVLQNPGWTSPSWRSPAAASCVRASATTATTSPWSPTSPQTTSACAGSTRSSSWPTSRLSSWRQCRATVSRSSTPTTTWCAGCAVGAPAASSGSPCSRPGPRCASSWTTTAAVAAAPSCSNRPTRAT